MTPAPDTSLTTIAVVLLTFVLVMYAIAIWLRLVYHSQEAEHLARTIARRRRRVLQQSPTAGAASRKHAQ